MSYHRTLSPGGRRMTNPGRASDSNFDPYYAQRHNTYASPRTSTGNVVPISTQTYLNLPTTNPGAGSNRPVSGYDSYSGRPRRSSLIDTSRGSSGSANHSRSRPTVVQDNVRPSSPPRRDRDYYITPASSKDKDFRKFEHKKVYSVDEGSAKLVADVDQPSRHHRRRESGDVERGGYKSLAHDRGRKPGYHANGKSQRTVDDDDAFSYTDPASMYKDTEPRWRPETRPRRGSVDRGGASRERPVSMIDQFGGDPRRSARDIGPPPSQRGWNRINDLGRSHSVRDQPTAVAHSPSRGREEPRDRYGDSRDPYHVPPRRSSTDRSNRSAAVHQDRPVPREAFPDFEDRRPRHERRLSGTRAGDRSVSRRGFGIRADSQDRWGARGSDESFEQRKRDLARDSGYSEQRGVPPPESDFTEADRRRVLPEESVYREPRQMRNNERSYDDYERDSDRERARKRDKERDRDYDRGEHHDRHHHRRDTDRDHKDSDKEGSDGIGGATKIAAGGLAGAAALFGLNREKDKKEEREKEKAIEREREEKRERERQHEWEREREREQERTRESERQREPERSIRFDERKERDGDGERRRRGNGSHSDEAPYERQRDPYADPDRGLGFAFEGPGSEAPRPRDAPREAPRESTRELPQVPPPQPPRDYERERGAERDFDRSYEQPPPAGQMPPAAMDPDADYRRRMEQVQRELGHQPQDHSFSSDSDPDRADRERRRREREARQAERQERMGNGNGYPDSSAGYSYSEAGPGATSSIPGSYRTFDDDASTAPSQSTWSDATSTPGLKRRNSVLDRSMDMGDMAQIIDNSQSERRENRVRIVDPPTDEDDKKPKGILKRPTEKFPEDPNAVREGVAPLKDANKKGIPPGARWTKIDRRLVNPEALEDAKERFEERLDFVIVLRVLTKDEIQKLADRTRELREKRHDQETHPERKSSRRRERNRDRKDRDEFEDDSENEFAPKPTRMLEAPSTAGSAAPSDADFIRDNRERRDREREGERVYASGGRGSRE